MQSFGDSSERSLSSRGSSQGRTHDLPLRVDNLLLEEIDRSVRRSLLRHSPEKSSRSPWLWIALSNLITCIIVLSSRSSEWLDLGTFHSISFDTIEGAIALGGRKTSVASTEHGTSNEASLESNQPHYLEKLMYKYGSDKSKDDHGYTDFYQMIFDPVRMDVRNVTEVGTSAGQSIQAWYHYFGKAQIYAYDWKTTSTMAQIANELADRVQYKEANLIGAGVSLRQDYGLYDETMDIVVEDAMHKPEQQHAFLEKLWPLVKPGGYYIIEDIAYPNEKSRWWHQEPEKLPKGVRQILQQNDAIFVDAHTGHRAWEEWQRRAGANAKSHLLHNSYLVVIRKRVEPVQPVNMMLRRVAMREDKVVKST